MLAPVARLNGRVFDDDPVITYMLLDMPKEERLAYLPTYWSILVKSALLNHALITEADGWKAASVVIPPGRHVDNVWTLFYAGFLGVLWRGEVALSDEPVADADDVIDFLCKRRAQPKI